MKYFSKTLLAASFLAMTTSSFAATNNAAASVSPAERAKIESVVHDYLLKNPELLVEVMQILQRKQYEQAEQTVKQTQQIAASFANPLFHQANDPVVGNPNGTVTLVEFFDYQCPHCVEMVPVMSAIIKANPNLRVVYKEFPIRGPISAFAARAALAANKQGKYEVFSHALLTANQPLTQDTILQIAKTSGLNVDQLKKDMDSDAIKQQLKANVKLAQDLKLMGTPAMFVGKTQPQGKDKKILSQGKDKINYLPGRTDEKQLQSTIDSLN